MAVTGTPLRASGTSPARRTALTDVTMDTANALVNCLRSDHSLENIPLVDIATLYHRK